MVLGEHRDPAVAAGGGIGEPVADRLIGVGWQHAVDERGLQDDEAVLGRDSVGVEHGVEVLAELGPVGLGDPRQDHAERGLALPGVLEDLPHRSVSVPAGAGHEQPQVRGVEELVGELVVGLDHRVDVGGVQQRDAPRHALAGGQHQQAIPARPGQALLADPGQRGQEVVLGEPVDVIGVAGQDRAVGRRPAHAGGAHVGADDAVHQGRLPRPGGADQRHQHGGGGPADPGQQVVIDLAEQLGAFGLYLGGTRDLEHQRDGRDSLAQVEQRGLEQARVHSHVGLGGDRGRRALPDGGHRGRRGRRGLLGGGLLGPGIAGGGLGSADILGRPGRGPYVGRSLVADRVVILSSVICVIRIAYVIRFVRFSRLIRLICLIRLIWRKRLGSEGLGVPGLVFLGVRLRPLRHKRRWRLRRFGRWRPRC